MAKPKLSEKEQKQAASIVLILVFGGLFLFIYLFYIYQRDKDLPREIVTVGKYQKQRYNAFTYYLPKPSESLIVKECKKLKGFHVDVKGEIVAAYFYDDLKATPNISGNLYFPDSSQAHLIATCEFNPYENIDETILREDVPK